MKKVLLIGVFLTVIIPTSLMSALITQALSTNPSGATSGSGQTFTLPIRATINSIAIASDEIDIYDLKVYAGDIGSCNNPGGEIYTQINIAVTNIGMTVVNLTVPPTLNVGVNTFCFYAATGVQLSYSAAAPYAGGTHINQAGPLADDLRFEIDYTAAPAAAISSAPLSPKGYIALAFSFIFAAWYVNRRREFNAI